MSERAKPATCPPNHRSSPRLPLADSEAQQAPSIPPGPGTLYWLSLPVVSPGDELQQGTVHMCPSIPSLFLCSPTPYCLQLRGTWEVKLPSPE